MNFIPSASDRNTVFISYARADRPHAERLARDLVHLGFGAWIDSEQLRPLAAWEREIQGAIQSSSYFFVLISSASIAPESYVHNELAYALALESQIDLKVPFVIPLRTENVRPHAGLRSRNSVDMFPSWNDGLRSIRNLTQPAPGPAIKRSLLRFFVLGSTSFWAAIYIYLAFSVIQTNQVGIAGKVYLVIACSLTAILLGFACGSFIMNFIRVRSRIAAVGVGVAFAALSAVAIYAVVSSA